MKNSTIVEDINRSEIVRAQYEAIVKVDQNIGTSLSAFRKLVGTVFHACRKEASYNETVKNENRNLYNKKVAGERNATIDAEFKKKLEFNADYLRTKYKKIIEAKMKRMDEYQTTPPTAEQMTLLQLVQMRGFENFSSHEMDLIAAKLADNDMAIKTLSAWGKDSDHMIIPPFNREKMEEQLQVFGEMLDSVIADLGNEKTTYFTDDFMSERPEAISAVIAESADLENGSRVPKNNITLLIRLKDAEQKAFDNGDINTYTNIRRFRETWQETIAEPGELRKEVVKAAEDLIAKVKPRKINDMKEQDPVTEPETGKKTDEPNS